MSRKLKSKSKRVNTLRSAFTLTEVVTASAILAFGMVPVLKALTNAHAATVIIEHKTRSLSLAQSKLEEIKARSIYDYSSDFDETNLSLDGSYLCKVTDSQAGPDLREICVSVGFDDNLNLILDPEEIDVSLNTCIARRY